MTRLSLVSAIASAMLSALSVGFLWIWDSAGPSHTIVLHLDIVGEYYPEVAMFLVLLAFGIAGTLVSLRSYGRPTGEDL